MTQRLVDRVLGSEIDRPTRVQRAFEGLGLWTQEMDDAQGARHGVAHEGAMPGDDRDWDRDRRRVGRVKTMLTALLAKATGYEGPIADRAETSFDITGKDEPGWWPVALLDEGVDYRGTGVDEARERALAQLNRLERQGRADAEQG